MDKIAQDFFEVFKKTRILCEIDRDSWDIDKNIKAWNEFVRYVGINKAKQEFRKWIITVDKGD